MGRALRREHLAFFVDRMTEHDKVADVTPIDSADDFLFEISRHSGLPKVLVHLTDAYKYGLVDYLARPDRLGRGSFVVIGMPHAYYDEKLVARAKADGIGIGQIGKFMGALNLRNVWEYESPEEKARTKRRFE